MKNLLLLILFVTAGVSAQECKFEINKIDDFSKAELLLTKSTKLASGYDYNLSISIGAENKNPFLNISANYSSRSVVVGSVDPSFFIQLNDDSILEFTATKVQGGGILTIIYPITVENLKKIKDRGFKKIKFETTQFAKEYDIKKVDKKLVENIDCVLKEIEK